jgi:tetratricopeptide (TPR) repeat protein
LAALVQAQEFPASFCVFREAVYAQNSDLLRIMRLYTAAKEEIKNELSGTDLYLALSRGEYLMGLSFQMEGKRDEAAAFYEQGIAWAEESLNLMPTSEGYRLLATNIALSCAVKSFSYALSNYGKIEDNAKESLALDPQNLLARYVIAAKYVSAPFPAGNPRKGAMLLEEITQQNIECMEKEDLFNLFMMLEAAYRKQKKNTEAEKWRERAAALYPGNNFISAIVK